MGVAPTEPLRDRAAELALELYELGAVRFALVLPHPQLLGRARAANQVLRFELLLFLLGPNAVLHAAEVGLVAREAKVVRALENCKLLQVSAVRGLE